MSQRNTDIHNIQAHTEGHENGVNLSCEVSMRCWYQRWSLLEHLYSYHSAHNEGKDIEFHANSTTDKASWSFDVPYSLV